MNNHLVGNGSTFDSDMFFIDMVVNFHTRSDDSDVDALYYYYMSTLIGYWTKVEALYSLSEEQAYLSVNMEADGYNRNFSAILSSFSEYRDTYLHNLNRITQMYISSRKLDVSLVTSTFNMMSSLLCFSFPRELYQDINFRNEDDYDYVMTRVYPLVNDDGVFSINGYLYAFINGVILLGIPNRTSTFDNIVGCPKAFEVHDIGHLENQYGTGILNRTQDIEEMYYSILHNNRISKNKKEYLLFALWFSVHELYHFGSFTEISDEYRNVLYDHDWFDVKIEDYEEMSQYYYDEKVSYEEYSTNQRKRLLSIIKYYSDYYERFLYL